MMHFVTGNRLELLRNGGEYFPALVAAINQAQHEIYIQTYIYANDDTGRLVGDALMQAAKRGIAVNLMIDGFGGKDFSKDYLKTLKTAGVQVRFYRPKISPWTFKKSRLRRLHRKVVVIDNTVGFVGGINIINDCEAPEKSSPRLDYALKVEGNLLPQMRASVVKMWQRNQWRSPRAWKTPNFWRNLVPTPDVPTALGQDRNGIEAAFVTRDNIFHKHDIEDAYLIAINAAKSDILIANAYFLPGRRFRHALMAAAKRGVRVQLLLQGKMEYFMMFATHAFYNILLKNHVEIYEYREGLMHSKVAVIDGYWATVGSSNIDPFSLLLAQEANVVVQDKAFAEQLKTDLQNCISNSAHQVDPDYWRSHKVKRICSWIAYGLLKFGLSLLGQTAHR